MTLFDPGLDEIRETACASVHLRKLSKLQETKLKRFPKLDVAKVLSRDKNQYACVVSNDQLPSADFTAYVLIQRGKVRSVAVAGSCSLLNPEGVNSYEIDYSARSGM